MTDETVRDFLHAAPFVPFTIFMMDGQSYLIDHPDFATLSRGGDIVVINTQGNRFAWVDLALATRIEAMRLDHAA